MEISKRKDVNLKEDRYTGQPLKPRLTSTDGPIKGLSNYDRDIMQALLNANPETALLIDKDGIVLITNYAAARRLGTSPERLIGSCLFDFFNPLESDVVRQRVAEAIKEGRRVRSIDQHEDRYYDVHYYPISDENGKIDRIAIFAIDVTKRKQTERALNSERLKFQVLADNIPLGIALIDKNDTYIYINPKFKELFGYSLEDIPDGETWFKKAWPDPEYRHRVIATWLDNFEHFKPGEKGSWIFNVTCKDGTEKTINFMPVQLESGEILMAYEDFTQFISARKALEESEEKLRLLFEKSVDPIFLVNGKGLIDCNESALKIMGCSSKEELLKHNIVHLSPEFQPDGISSKEKARHIYKKTMEEGSSHFEWVHRTLADEEFWADVSITVITLGGRPIFYTVWRDITERKRTEEELRKSEAELQAKSSSLEEANTALKVLLKHREEDKREMEERFLSNVKELVIPYIEKLKRSRLDPGQMAYVDIIDANLNDIISPFLQKMSLRYTNFTPAEIQVANLIKVGKTSKEIAEILKVSPGTIDTHRNNIRSKLGLNKKKINLRTYLLSLK